MRYAIFDKENKFIGTVVGSETPEAAIKAHNDLLPTKGVRAEPLSQTRNVNEAYIEFAKLMRNEYFEKGAEKEYCSNSGDPGEACECCPELDKDGNEVNDADTAKGE